MCNGVNDNKPQLWTGSMLLQQCPGLLQFLEQIVGAVDVALNVDAVQLAERSATLGTESCQWTLSSSPLA